MRDPLQIPLKLFFNLPLIAIASMMDKKKGPHMAAITNVPKHRGDFEAALLRRSLIVEVTWRFYARNFNFVRTSK